MSIQIQEEVVRFKGKTAVVTGGGGGMGGAICTAFAEEGADVAVLDINIANARSIAEKITGLGRKALAFSVDVSEYGAVDDVIRKIIAEFNHVDILVNTAGITPDRIPFSRLTEEAWDLSMTVNLKSVFNPTRAVINHMIERKYGKIISISSVAGDHGSPMIAPYAAAKAGINAMSKSLAKEVASLGINVNVIAPGAVITPFTGKMDQDFHKKVLENTPAGRAGTPLEIAALTLFLASEEAVFIVGQVISPNGGTYI
jgi:3-oxoacyl-[acyl-carrier protein] reductase